MVTEEERMLVIRRLQNWIQMLPPAERNLPIKVVGTRTLTPMEMLEEVKKGTPIGDLIVKEELEKIKYFERYKI